MNCHISPISLSNTSYIRSFCFIQSASWWMTDPSHHSWLWADDTSTSSPSVVCRLHTINLISEMHKDGHSILQGKIRLECSSSAADALVNTANVGNLRNVNDRTKILGYICHWISWFLNLSQKKIKQDHCKVRLLLTIEKAHPWLNHRYPYIIILKHFCLAIKVYVTGKR